MKLGMAICALVVCVSCNAATPRMESTSAEPDVTIETFAFEPSVLRVRTGEPVVWRNDDDILHTVTSGLPKRQGVPGVSKDRAARPDGAFDRELGFEETFAFSFDKPGTFVYFCDIHSGMRARVIVTE